MVIILANLKERIINFKSMIDLAYAPINGKAPYPRLGNTLRDFCSDFGAPWVGYGGAFFFKLLLFSALYI